MYGFNRWYILFSIFISLSARIALFYFGCIPYSAQYKSNVCPIKLVLLLQNRSFYKCNPHTSTFRIKLSVMTALSDAMGSRTNVCHLAPKPSHFGANDNIILNTRTSGTEVINYLQENLSKAVSGYTKRKLTPLGIIKHSCNIFPCYHF